MGQCKVISWFKRKHNKDVYETVTTDVPMTTIYRWYLYDTELTDNVNKLAELIGLNPISEEGEAKELEESADRIKNMSPLFPYLESMAGLSATAITAMHTEELLDNLNEEDKEDFLSNLQGMTTVYKAVALSTLIGAFSVGLELGIINHDTINSGTLTIGELDE